MAAQAVPDAPTLYTPRVLTALRMREQNIPWKEVYLAVIHAYATLHPCERILLARNLRRATAALVKRRRKI